MLSGYCSCRPSEGCLRGYIDDRIESHCHDQEDSWMLDRFSGACVQCGDIEKGRLSMNSLVTGGEHVLKFGNHAYPARKGQCSFQEVAVLLSHAVQVQQPMFVYF